MAAHPDPLVLLRQAISSRSEVHLLATDSKAVYSLKDSASLSFSTPKGRFPLAKDLPTRYRKPDASADADPATNPTAFYDLQSLLCCYLNRDKPVGVYIQDATQQGCAFVSITERKTVADFLEGKLGTGVEPSSVLPLPEADVNAQLAPSGSSAAGPLRAAGEPPSKRAKYIPNREDQESVRKIFALHEPRLVADRKTVLRGQKLVNFENVKALVADRMKMGREEQRMRGGGGLTRPLPSSTPAQGQKKRPLNPIIIISPSSSALITMANVKRFLEDAVFSDPTSGPRATEDVVVVNHRRTSSSAAAAAITAAKGQASDHGARYFVVDGVEALGKFGEEVWDRVVCVMTTGQEWQFRPYKWSDPKELFHHVKGFFVQWTHDPPNPKVRAWNVTELRLDQSKRYIDKSAAADFWRGLEAWIALHKPFLAY